MSKEEIILTQSAVNTWDTCQVKWYLLYYKKIRKIRTSNSGPLRMGTAFHEALETLHGSNSVQGATARMLQIHQAEADFYGKSLKCKKEVLFFEAQLRIERFKLRYMLHDYVRETQVDGKDKDFDVVIDHKGIIMMEQTFKTHMAELGYANFYNQGKIDGLVLDRKSGKQFLHEIKTTGDPVVDRAEELGRHHQIWLYQHMLQQNGFDPQGAIGDIIYKPRTKPTIKESYGQYEARVDKARSEQRKKIEVNIALEKEGKPPKYKNPTATQYFQRSYYQHSEFSMKHVMDTYMNRALTIDMCLNPDHPLQFVEQTGNGCTHYRRPCELFDYCKLGKREKFKVLTDAHVELGETYKK